MIRRNVLVDERASAQFVEGVLALKDPARFPWPGQAGLSVYDYFAFWHARTMMTFTPPSQSDRNAAHSGPAFLPWHRYFLLRFEGYLRAATGDDGFRLPYWDWASDAGRDDPRQSPVWGGDRLGRFTRDDFRVHLAMNGAGAVVPTDRALQRRLGAAGALPARGDVAALFELTAYDAPPYDSDALGFRNTLEGWTQSGASRLHNAVHVWVGGDMELATSPNDPTFYLHHCNIDRIWSAWQARRPDAPYLPPADAPADLAFHRLDDPLYTFFDERVTPAQMLSHEAAYRYDTLADLP